MSKRRPLYRCFQCPALYWSSGELARHRGEHKSATEDFWVWFYRKHGMVV